MLQKDLTTSYPRSVRDKYLGLVQLGRAVDKGIATADGKNGEYNFDCPMDNGVFGFLGVDGKALLEVIKNANSEAEIEAYLKPFVDKKTPEQIQAFNEEFVTHAPEPGSDGEKYFLGLRSQAAPDRTDVTTWTDLLDLDEKRNVPQRVTA
ncbi:MAG TPA: DUF5069 domain-containing protein [Candidatus Elarobacter sp.]|jgi:hypothetical protein|nr:DUF5069 domain-containing protein [Candidatus Elarobacter sp.]